MTVLTLAGKLLIYIGIGFAARKCRVMADGFDKLLSRFLMAIPLPCLVINSFRIDFSMEDLLNCPVILALALGLMAVNYGVAHLVYLSMGKTGAARAVRFGLTFTNFTFFGLAVVNEICGAQGVFYYVIFTLPIRFFFYGGAPLTLGGPDQRAGGREILKKFFCAPVIGVFIGFALYLTQLSLPGLVSDVLTALGNMASPLGLMLCGTILADADLRGLGQYPCVLWVTVLRLAGIPALVLGLMVLLRVDGSIIRTILYYFAMPVASFLPTFCLRYNPEDPQSREVGGYLVIASTLLSILTIPAWAWALTLLGI